MTFFNSLKYRQWLYFFLLFLCEDSGFATAVKTAPVVGKPNGRGEHSQPHRCGIPGVGNDVGQVGLHHSGVSGVQAGSLGLHQYIQLPLFQQQDFLTGMDHRQVAVLAVGFQLKAYDQRLRYKISVGHGRKQMIPYIGIGLGEDHHIRLTGCQASAALTSHKQIGGDVQSGAEFAQGGQGRVGEAAPFEPVTGESAATVLEALKLFRTGLIGMDPLDVEGIHRMMDRLLSGNTSAKAAVDIALYDIKGKLMGQPLYKVLGGSMNQIVTDMTVGIDTPEAMAAEARERVEKDGFTILKIKAGINPIEDIRALTLIRQAVGPNIRLRVDANQGYTVSDAVRTLKAFEEVGVEAVEQCLPSWDLDGMRFVRSKVDLKVMLDESVHTPIDAAKACKIDAADIINIKLMKCGGLYPAEKINAIAEANHVQCMVGCMLETKVAIAAGVSLVAAKQNITEADCDSFMYAVDPEMGMPGGFAVNGGVYTLSDKPGLGIDIDF